MGCDNNLDSLTGTLFSSTSLRIRVVNYVNDRKTITEAALVYEISSSTVHRWMHREKLEATVLKRRPRKMIGYELVAELKQYPDATHKPRAEKFGF